MGRIKRAAALAIVGTAYAAGLTAIGGAARGPFADGGIWRDFAVGAELAAAAAALGWALNELGGEGEE